MADDRIDIEINDAIDASIPKKLRDIATNADKGETAVKKLKAALASINSSPAARLKTATEEVTTSLNGELAAQNKLTAARERSALATAKAATAEQRLATEVAKTAAAEARAATAAVQGERAALALAAAQQRAAASQDNLAARAERLRMAVDPLYAAQSRFNNELREAETLFAQGAIGADTFSAAADRAGTRLRTASDEISRVNSGLTDTGVRAKGAGHHTANIAAQMNDLGVQFAMAAQSGEPLKMVFMALIQQGSQLAYVAGQMEGGWAGMARTMGGMLLRFAPLIAAIGAVVLAIKALQVQANDDSGLKKYAESLGLTAKEAKKLEDVHVTMGDTLKATWQVLSENLLSTMGLTTKDVRDAWSSTVNFVLELSKALFGGLWAGGRAIFMTLKAIGENTLKIVANTLLGVINVTTMGVEKIINGAIIGLNALAKAANAVGEKAGIGEIFGTLEEVNLGISDVTYGMLQLSKVDPFGEFVTGAKQANKAFDDIAARAQENARDRLKGQATKIIEDRGAGAKPKVDKTEENRAQALKLINMELDNELKRMQMLKPEREFQQRMDQIDQQLAQKKIQLSKEERTALEDKVRAIQANAHVQQELDRLYEEAVGPMRTYNAANQAAKQLLDAGVISLERYNQELAKNKIALEQVQDPLYDLKEGLAAAEIQSKLYGDALQKQIVYEQIRQAMLTKGIVLSAQYVEGVNAEVDALMRRNAALQQQQFIQTQVSAVVDPMLEERKFLESKTAMYAEIDRLRQNDVLKEEEAERAKAAILARYNEIRLKGVQSFFGELAGLSSSGNKKLAAIGKAAAVAQATIDGFVAVQKALASAPPPLNFALAAAVAAKTGVQVAGIMSTNAGSFQNGGAFMVDGRAGVDRNNVNMNVSRGERVTIETPAQQRANDNGSGGAPIVNTKVINQFDEREFLAAFDSDEGEEIILNVIRRNPNVVKAAGS